MSSGRRVLVLVQARTSSTRLPAKALLPLGGFPLALLSALRAGRDGLETRLATSSDPSDDELARLAARAGIPVQRGPLHDPLARFVEAASDAEDAAVIVRLTADNVFPDAALVRELVRDLEGRGLRYVRTSTEAGLPYGVSVEAFDAGALRAADREARTAYEREHVTPAVRRLFGDALFERHVGAGLGSHLRATVDTFADYQRVLRVFAAVDDPVGASWEELSRRLGALPDAPRSRLGRSARHPGLAELVVGTAQLGMPYGIANADGVPGEDEIRAILETASAHGVTHLDTARVYGDSEASLGRHLAHVGELAVVTKLRPLDDGRARSPREWALEAERSLLESLVALKADAVSAVLFHRERDVDLGEGAVLDRLSALRDGRKIGALGVSVQSPEEALRALRRPALTHIQLPMNLLDRRWDEVARAREERPDVVIVARSVLLQGLLSGRVPPSRFPRCEGVEPVELAEALSALASELGREDAVDLALAFVRGEPWIDAVVLGVERAAQVRDAARRFEAPPLDDEARARVREVLPPCPVELLDPSRWTFDDPEGPDVR